MEDYVHIGLDVHKKLISYCVKDVCGRSCSQANSCYEGATRPVDERTSPPWQWPWTRPSSRLGSRYLSACAASEGGASADCCVENQAPSNVSSLAGRSHNPFCARPLGLRQQRDVWLSMKRTSAVRARNASCSPNECMHALPEGVGRAFALLTRTYHGGEEVVHDPCP